MPSQGTMSNKGQKKVCFRCPLEFDEIDGHYIVSLNAYLCGDCGSQYNEMVNKHNAEEEKFLHQFGKGKK